MVIDRDLESASSESMNLRPPNTVKYVCCVCLCRSFLYVSVCSVCVLFCLSCVCVSVHVVCVLCVCSCGVFVCSGKANDWENRECVVFDLLSNVKWARSTLKNDP